MNQKKKKKKRQKQAPQKSANKKGKAPDKKKSKDKPSPKKTTSEQPTAKASFIRIPARWLEWADLMAAVIYLAIYWILELPGSNIGYDVHHQTYLLMSSLRIIEGQVPFLDYIPWYGPLYHYFTALWVWILGQDLLSVKIYLVAISPLFSMAAFIVTLRMLRIPAWARLFGIVTCALWGADRIVYCGSTRSFIGLLGLALLVWGVKKPFGSYTRAMFVPLIFLVFLFSPEVGVFLAVAALALSAMDLISLAAPERKKALVYYIAGAAAWSVPLVILYITSDLLKNYMENISFLSGRIWAYALPMPGLVELSDKPRSLLYFLPLGVYTVAGLWMANQIRHGRVSQIPLWVMACAVFGGLLWNTTYLRTHSTHLLFSLPPALALMGMLFQKDSRFGWIKLVMMALVIISVPFFNDGDSKLQYRYWKLRSLDKKRKESIYKDFLGVKTVTARAKMVEDVKTFINTQKNATFLFPLSSFEAHRVGQPLRLPFDDLYYTNVPGHYVNLTEEVRKIAPDYVSMDTRHILWLLSGEDSDSLMDLIAANYQLIKVFNTNMIYKRLPRPVKHVSLMMELPGPFILNQENDFSVEWNAPPGYSQGYVEMDEKFHYLGDFLVRFSLPEVKVFANEEYLKRRQKHGQGRERIRNTPEGSIFRTYLPNNVKKVKMKIIFPGSLNIRPEKVEISNVRFYRFNFKPQMPYSDRYFDQGY